MFDGCHLIDILIHSPLDLLLWCAYRMCLLIDDCQFIVGGKTRQTDNLIIVNIGDHQTREALKQGSSIGTLILCFYLNTFINWCLNNLSPSEIETLVLLSTKNFTDILIPDILCTKVCMCLQPQQLQILCIRHSKDKLKNPTLATCEVQPGTGQWQTKLQLLVTATQWIFLLRLLEFLCWTEYYLQFFTPTKV